MYSSKGKTQNLHVTVPTYEKKSDHIKSQVQKIRNKKKKNATVFFFAFVCVFFFPLKISREEISRELQVLLQDIWITRMCHATENDVSCSNRSLLPNVLWKIIQSYLPRTIQIKFTTDEGHARTYLHINFKNRPDLLQCLHQHVNMKSSLSDKKRLKYPIFSNAVSSKRQCHHFKSLREQKMIQFSKRQSHRNFRNIVRVCLLLLCVAPVHVGSIFSQLLFILVVFSILLKF